TGEDGAVQGILALLGLPYVGSSATACRRAFDKPSAKDVIRAAGLATPDWVAIPKTTFRDLGTQAVLDAGTAALPLPLFVKPARGGSSLGAVAAILLIVNTVQIAAYTRKTEVSIMRLVGATRWYTQLPFLLEAVVAAVVGAVLAIGGLFLAKIFFFDKALEDLYGVNILARITTADVWFVSPWLVLSGILLAGLTAYGTLRVYVRE
ncbi:MAG: FtsX-like permease family protein, partial [Gordonia sp. (in: high G+C Gram-positive bacteria)]|nr:FtsX-like permease family protein [Gordonia sp. (in: high G+C Gram-positive bacteria)]